MSKFQNLKTICFLTEGGKRRLYLLEDGSVIKVPKNSEGYEESRFENEVYASLPPSIVAHICPILQYSNGCIRVRKATPLAVLFQQGDIEFEDMERMIASKQFVADYLEQQFGVDPKDLACGMNWGLLDDEVVVLDFGRKKS